MGNLLELINKIKEDRKFRTFDESSTKQFVVLRILSSLGWNIYDPDEIQPEYSIGSFKVDFALKHKEVVKVFIEVKRFGEPLENHQEQLLKYAFQRGIKLAVLTNGGSWWFYLPLMEGSWERRKFYTIEIYEQDINDVVDKFEKLLSKKNVMTDRAITNAEQIYENRLKEHLIRQALPKAWEKLLLEPDELLVELLSETAERLCGYKPMDGMVKGFLRKMFFEESNQTRETLNEQAKIDLEGERRKGKPKVGKKSYLKDLIEIGILKSGEEIFRVYKGKIYKARIMRDGKIQLSDGRIANSPSEAASFISGNPENGWKVWKYRNSQGSEISLADLRDLFLLISNLQK
jgi:hypothetical protein